MASWLKHMNSVLPEFTWKPMPLAAYYRLYNGDSAWAGVFVRSPRSSM